MADTEKRGDMSEVLKPFYERASEAEERLSRLEASLASKKGIENEKLLKKVGELQSKLEETEFEHASKLEKAQKANQKLETENAKLQYRIVHLVGALKEVDCKLESMR